MRRACPFLGAALLVATIACGAGAQASLFSHDVTADAAAPNDSTKPQEGPDVTVRLGGLLQAWYIAGDGDPANTFRIRRAEFRITGTMSPRVGFTLLADAAKQLTLGTTTQDIDTSTVVKGVAVNQSSRMLLDAYVSVLPLKHLRVEVGQQRIPFSAEGLMSATRLETPERAQFASSRERGGSFGDVRDLGLMIRGIDIPHLEYAVAVMNGSGESQNTTDRNTQKAMIGRVVGVAGGLRVGASGVYGGEPTADRLRRDRVGADAELTLGGFTARSEYVTGVDGAVHRTGYYGLVAVRVLPWAQLVGRLDSWDPDTRHEDDEATARSLDAIGGATFAIAARSRVQVDLVRRSFGDAAPAATSLLVSFETAW